MAGDAKSQLRMACQREASHRTGMSCIAEVQLSLLGLDSIRSSEVHAAACIGFQQWHEWPAVHAVYFSGTMHTILAISDPLL